ncbi:MAG: hypothetical protein FWC95_07490, partial [Defluviitaleaceae bacterium]|nr:hypothetical protein [Defluviitaleaceae bacterium]
MNTDLSNYEQKKEEIAQTIKFQEREWKRDIRARKILGLIILLIMPTIGLFLGFMVVDNAYEPVAHTHELFYFRSEDLGAYTSSWAIVFLGVGVFAIFLFVGFIICGFLRKWVPKDMAVMREEWKEELRNLEAEQIKEKRREVWST